MNCDLNVLRRVGYGRITALVLLCVAPTAVRAQYDDMFYRPEREWLADAGLPPHEDVWTVSGADSIHAAWFVPEPVAPIAAAAALAAATAPATAPAAYTTAAPSAAPAATCSASATSVPLFPTNPRGIVLFCHGNYGNLSYNGGAIRPLVEAGYAVLAWDYPGFGRSGGKPTHASIAEAGARVFETLMTRNEVRGKKVIIYGYSIGCHVAARLARANAERTALLVLDGGIVSFTEMAVHFSPPEAHDAIRQYVASPYSAIDDVAHLGGVPTLVAHSREDALAPFVHGETLYGAATEPKLMLEYAGGHVSALAADAPAALAAIEKLTN